MFGFQGRDAIFQFLQSPDHEWQEFARSSFQSTIVVVADHQILQPGFDRTGIQHCPELLGYESGFFDANLAAITHVPGKIYRPHLSRASLSAVIVVTWARMAVMALLPRVIVLLVVAARAVAPHPKTMLLTPVVVVPPALQPRKTL